MMERVEIRVIRCWSWGFILVADFGGNLICAPIFLISQGSAQGCEERPDVRQELPTPCAVALSDGAT
jgi:hypothetical protein